MKTQLALFCILLFNAVVEADEISIRADEWFPMNGIPHSDRQGYMIDIATQIFSEFGYSVDYDILPWRRAVTEVEHGNFDCVVGAYVEDVPSFTFPKKSWGMVNTGVFVRADDSFVFQGVESLKVRKVGIISGYAYSSEMINQSIKNSPQIYQVMVGKDPLQSNIRKLLHNRIDTIVENPAVMAAKLNELSLTHKVKLAGNVGELSPIYIACTPGSKRAKKIIAMVNQGIDKLRASGALEIIMNRYGLTDWHKD